MGVLAREKRPFRSLSRQHEGTATRPRAGNGRQGPRVDLQSLIGDQLKLYYADLLREPVPERLVSLLEKLDSQEGGRS